MFIVRFADFDNINEVEKYKGFEIKVSKEESVELPDNEYYFYEIIGCQVMDEEGKELIAWQPEAPTHHEPPKPATEPLLPEQMESIEELYLTGLHLEQYRHATRSPEDYWREGLRREPHDARLNNAMGLALLRRGRFAEAEQHFVRAVQRLTLRNPNPYDGEPFYNLGLARIYQGNLVEAYTAFHKAVWNYAWQSAGYYWLAAISLRRGDLPLALEQVERSLSVNAPNLNARALKANLLRRMGRNSEAQALIDETLAGDLDHRCSRLQTELLGNRGRCRADLQSHDSGGNREAIGPR